MSKSITREEWLNKFAAKMGKAFIELGQPLPEKLHISCGFPSSGARGKTIGECWYEEASLSGHVEIFIKPDQHKAMDVAAILAHELVHAALGAGFGHGKEFKKIALGLGLVGPMKSTTAGELFIERAQPIIDKIGDYPHEGLQGIPQGKKPQKNEPMFNLRCPECDYFAKTTESMLEIARLCCPVDGEILLTKKERDGAESEAA